jgi:hypothetical protein
LTSAGQGDTIPAMFMKRSSQSELFSYFFILTLGVLLLSACEVPDWIYDPNGGDGELTADSYPQAVEIGATGTPIDAMVYASPTPLNVVQYPQGVTPSPVLITATPEIQETAVEVCSDPASGNSLTYDQALAIASNSPCMAEGALLPAHFCNENSGTWWIGLDAAKDGCNPACVVNPNGLPAEIDWRCTETITPGESELVLEKFSDWRGEIERRPQGSQVAYRFVDDDGRLFNIDSPDNAIRQQFAVAAWNGAGVQISGEITAVSDSLLVQDLAFFLTKNQEARDLSPFAMASSSSQLPVDDGGIYFAWAVIDGQESQPWCEGVEGDGSGEWLQLDFTSPVEITSLRLSNGFQGGNYLYEVNGRVKELALYFDGELVDNWQVDDSTGQQSFDLAGGVVPGIVANSLKLVIEETYPGWEFEDTCIAEIEVWGRPAE